MKWIDKVINIIEKPLKVLGFVLIAIKTLNFLSKELSSLKDGKSNVNIEDAKLD